MAYYDNLAAEQPWSLQPAFGGDAWIPDLFARETEALTKVLQSSFGADGDFFASEAVDTAPFQTPTPSGGSENEVPRRCSIPPRASGRVAKRKSRASKRAAATTFITADPANFRQMVQQVTGVRFDGMNGVMSPSVFKPESLQAGRGGGLPTLDTSAFLLDVSDSTLVSQPRTAAPDGGAAAPEYYFDSFCSFPTLESWKAVE